MKVLIWKDYGEITVYCAESIVQLYNIATTVVGCLEDWGLDDECSKFMADIDAVIENHRVGKAVGTVVGKVRQIISDFALDHLEDCNHEAFEQFFFDEVKYECS